MVEREPGETWGAPVNLSQGGRFVSLCYGWDGTLHAAWQQFRSSGGVGDWLVVYSRRPDGGEWAQAETVARGMAAVPYVGVDNIGNVHLIFWSGAAWRLAYCARNAAGDWSQPEAVPCPPRVSSSSYRLSVEPEGTCHVAYTAVDSSYDDWLYWSSRPPGGTWSAPALVSPLPVAFYPALAAGPGGVYLAAIRYSGAMSGVAVWRHSPPAGWSEPDTLCPDRLYLALPSVAVCPGGQVAVAWEKFSTGAVKVAHRGERWTQAVAICDSLPPPAPGAGCSRSG